MGDSDSETSSTLSTDSSSCEIDNVQKDPTYKCYVKNVSPSAVKKRLRSGQSKASSLSVFPVGSGANQSGNAMAKSNSTSSLDVTIEDHDDIENDPIYINPYNSGRQGNCPFNDIYVYEHFTEPEISIEPIVDPLSTPEISINLLPHSDQTFIAIISPSNEGFHNEWGEL